MTFSLRQAEPKFPPIRRRRPKIIALKPQPWQNELCTCSNSFRSLEALVRSNGIRGSEELEGSFIQALTHCNLSVCQLQESLKRIP